MNDISPETPEGRMVVSPELGQRLSEAKANVTEHMNLPNADIVGQTEQIGLLASFGNLYKEMITKKLSIGFKDVKAVLGIIPFVPMISGVAKAERVTSSINKAVSAEMTAVKAQKTASKAERWAKWFKGSEKAQQKAVVTAAELTRAKKEAGVAAQAAKAGLEAARTTGAVQAARGEGAVSRFIRKHIVHDFKEADYVLNYEKAIKSGKALTDTEKVLAAASGELPAKTLAERVAKRSGKVGKHLLLHNLGPIIDPSPDVPGVVVLGSLGAELFGQVWAGLIPSTWQYIHNRYESAKVNWETAMKAKDIIKTHFEKKIGRMKDPDVQKAAAVFT